MNVNSPKKKLRKRKKTRNPIDFCVYWQRCFPLNTCGHKQFAWYFFFFRLSYLLLMMTVLCSPSNKNKSKFGVGIIKTLINGYCKMIAYRMRGTEKKQGKMIWPDSFIWWNFIASLFPFIIKKMLWHNTVNSYNPHTLTHKYDCCSPQFHFYFFLLFMNWTFESTVWFVSRSKSFSKQKYAMK